MTVCIAGVCRQNEDSDQVKIILCSDSRLQTDEAGGDVGLKMDVISEGIVGMVAGDFATGLECMEHLRKAANGKTFQDSLELAQFLRQSLKSYRQALVEVFIDHRLSMSYQQFLNIGRDKLPSTLFREIFDKIPEIDLGCEMLITGFLGSSEVVMFQITQYGEVLKEDPFACIGSGGVAASVSLFYRKYRERLKLPEARYYIYEAKRVSEVAPGVGKETHMFILSYNPVRHKVELGVVSKAEIDLILDMQFSRFGPQEFISADLPIMRAGSEDQQSPTAGSLHQQPSPGSPGGFDQS